MDFSGILLSSLWAFAQPNLWWIIPAVVLVVVASFPMPGRGPGSSRRDVWRGFRFAAREVVMARADRRCEAAGFIIWGRCSDAAVEVDHVFPWSRGGPTVVSNGQALCTAHNRNKGSVAPTWWYVLGLERRRRRYFPSGVDVRVFATYAADELAARERWRARRMVR
jgi:hypothetical protein